MNKKQKLVFAFLDLIVHAAPEELARLNVTIGARRLGTTPDIICHAFKSVYICSAGEIVTINKQIAFEKLIANRRARTLKEALKILDIRSVSNFIKHYKARRGCTPKETIKKHKKSQGTEKRNHVQK